VSREPPLPSWAVWRANTTPYTLGIEEEVMLLDPDDWLLANRGDEVLHMLPQELQDHASVETHAAAIELSTGVHEGVASAVAELRDLRVAFERELGELGLRAATAGTHPLASWHSTMVSGHSRYQTLYASLRELARREPTFALHVHVGVADPEDAIRLVNRLRVHLPILLALSANSPFCEGRDTGLASMRTPVFQAFPRAGIPRRFADYWDWADGVDALIRCGAIPEPTFIWWDVRPQPRFGTVEVRIMDAQTTVDETAALVALVQSLARLELDRGFAHQRMIAAQEAINENRFIAARDGVDARLVEVDHDALVPLEELLDPMLRACELPAALLECTAELESVRSLARANGAVRQRRLARKTGLDQIAPALADRFTASGSDSRGRQNGQREPSPSAPV
jgi:carboxylate-amine ligase